MNNYLIQSKVGTVAELIKPFEAAGFYFRSYSDEFWNCDAWVATKEVKAETGGEARSIFYRELIPCIERFSVVSQCAFRIVANSYFIYKKTNNLEKIVYIYYVREVGHTGLHFDQEEIEQLSKFDSISNKASLMYISEAANASTFYTKLAMLLSAAESFAGQIFKKGQVKTNHAELSKILGGELHDRLYKYEVGLRHQLFHGNIKSHDLFDGLTETVYDKLREYLKTKYDIELDPRVVHPQRNFNGNYQAASTFDKLIDEKYLDLKLIEPAFDEDNPNRHKIWRSMFSDYVRQPYSY